MDSRPDAPQNWELRWSRPVKCSWSPSACARPQNANLPFHSRSWDTKFDDSACLSATLAAYQQRPWSLPMTIAFCHRYSNIVCVPTVLVELFLWGRPFWCSTGGLKLSGRSLSQAVVTGKFRNTMHPRRTCRQVSEVLTTLRSPLPKYGNSSQD